MEPNNSLNPVIVYDIEKNHELDYEKFKGRKALFIYQTVKANIEGGVKTGLYFFHCNFNYRTSSISPLASLIFDNTN